VSRDPDALEGEERIGLAGLGGGGGPGRVGADPIPNDQGTADPAAVQLDPGGEAPRDDVARPRRRPADRVRRPAADQNADVVAERLPAGGIGGDQVADQDIPRGARAIELAVIPAISARDSSGSPQA
jgi:hypothetical protein